MLLGWSPTPSGWKALLPGWGPSLLGCRPSLLGWNTNCLEAVATNQVGGHIAIRLEAIAIRLEDILPLGWRPSLFGWRPSLS